MSIHRLVILQTMYGQKKNFSTFSYKLVQISPIMILVNSGAFLSISSWFCELTELIFVMIPYISSTGYPPPPKRKGLWVCASSEYRQATGSWPGQIERCQQTHSPLLQLKSPGKEFGKAKYADVQLQAFLK